MQEYRLGQVKSVKQPEKKVEKIEVETTPIEKPKTTKNNQKN